MILCFSGTGNSRHVAGIIAKNIDDTVCSANELIKKGSSGRFESERPYVFVCPAYAWRIPRVFEELILSSSFSGNKKAYFVLTCGDSSGNASHYAEMLCLQKGLEFMGLSDIVMPENYIAMFKSPSKKTAKKIIERAEPHILSAIAYIKAQQAFPMLKRKLLAKIKSCAVPHLFYPVVVSAKGFYSTSACTACGKCAILCPLNNIQIENDKTLWGKKCTHCMACICGCPLCAIEYSKKTQGKNRHYLP